MALIRRLLAVLAACLLVATAAQARLAARGSDGEVVTLAQPAQRIVSLAPHLTDLLLALGAREHIVGVVDDHEQRGAHAHSRSGFPVVADAASINYERVLALKPDLVLAWGSGTPAAWVAQQRRLGIPVLVMEAATLAGVAQQIEQLGRLSGRDAAARQQATAFRKALAALARATPTGPRLRYFYQAWRQPLYSLNANHLLSQALGLCGADSIVPPSAVAAPLISPEFVLRENPDILLFNHSDAAASWRYWRRFASLTAVRRQQWLALDDPRLTRPGPDMLSAIRPVCAQIATWRKQTAIKQR